jgi:hypothetical protein
MKDVPGDKQSQSPAAGKPHHSTILSFHHPKSMPIVQNKANCPRGPSRERIVRNKPNFEGQSTASARLCVRNKANWPPGRCRARTPNPRRAEGQPCETKPIRRRIVRNEPNSRRRRVGRGSRDAGQSCKTKPIRWQIMRNEPNSAQPREGPGEPKMRNEPNPGRCGCGEPPLCQYSIIPAFQSSGVGRGANVRNEANFGGSFKFEVSRRARSWSGLQTSHFTLQTQPEAGRAKQSQLHWGTP